jgi:hypothetical protein
MRVERIGNATLYLGDCREVLPAGIVTDVVITDPVWPNCPPGLLAGSDRPYALLSETLKQIEAARTVVIILGFDSDPRFLGAVPSHWPFIRSQQLPYVFPAYAGRLLRGDEVAYAFGAIPKGRGLIPGRARTIASHKKDRATGHPSPRADDHMRQLVGWWSLPDDQVLDPFMGTGATGVAAVSTGRSFMGVEINAEYFDIACERIARAQDQGTLSLECTAENVPASPSAALRGEGEK